MHNYNNFVFDSFKNNVRMNQVADTKSANNSVGSPASGQTEGASTISNVTPDYNVSVPCGYTKTGVEKLSNGQEIHCYKLNNGQKVYIAPKDSAKTVLNTYVNTGALNEKDDERGISHFCEHMAFNGTKGTQGYMKLGKSDVFKIVADLGGYTNASTNYAETNYTISIPQFNQDDFEKIVKIQSSMMNNLELSEEMTEKEHGPVTSEINMYSDMPDSVVSNLAVKNLFNINTTSNDIVAGRVDNILNVDSKKVTEYFKNNYFPANMTTVVTGDVNPDKAIEIIAKNFKGENPVNPDRRLEPLNPVQKTVRKDIISPKAVATNGILCFAGPKNNDAKGCIEIFALNHLLFNKKHSILTKALEPYNVEIQAAGDKIRTQAEDPTLLSLTYSTSEENSEIALKSIFDKISNFKAPTDEEMETLKTGIKMKYEQKYEDMERLNYMIGSSSLNGGIEECVDAIKIIDNMTPQDLINALHKYYDLNKASIAVIHPESANSNSLEAHHKKAKSISFKGGLNGVNGTASKKQPLKMEKIQRYKLSNNCDVAITESKNSVAAFSAYISCPVPADTKPGVTELLEEILLKGSDDVVKLVDKNNINAYTGATNGAMYYEAEFPAKNTSTALKIMKKTMLTPEFNEATFLKAKKDLKTNILTTQPKAFDNMKKLLFPDSARGYNNSDILKNIDNITLGDVMGLHKYLLDNGGITFSASLPTEKYPAIKNVVDTELSEFPTFKENNPRIFNDYKPTKASKVATDISNTAQADIVQAYKFPINHDVKELTTYRLMNAILSHGDDTGLFANLREKEKLAYMVFSDIELADMKSGVLSCHILTTTDSDDIKSYENVQKSIDGFTRQIGKMKSGEFTDSEFEAAKLGLKRQLLEATDNMPGITTSLSKGLRSVNGLDSINKTYNAIDEITREDIQRVAQEVFKNKPLYSIRASKNTIDANKEYLSKLES